MNVMQKLNLIRKQGDFNICIFPKDLASIILDKVMEQFNHLRKQTVRIKINRLTKYLMRITTHYFVTMKGQRTQIILSIVNQVVL